MIPKSILDKCGAGLHTRPGHPLDTIRQKIYEILPDFDKHDGLSPRVSAADNFDALLIPADHPSRRTSDTFYYENGDVLRTHTSAHQNQLMLAGGMKFLVTGDVFRKDEIDRFHYPVFHQMEGVATGFASQAAAESDLHSKIQKIIGNLFGDVRYKKVDSYFPFTEPSWEYEIFWQGKWVEILGCGLVQRQILDNCGVSSYGWAFGLGLERLAMILFEVPDIRLFWTADPRFHEQFRPGEISRFNPYSNHPACTKDITFWLPDQFEPNEFFQVVRDSAGELIESIVLIDSFQRGGRTSHCYRISYRANDRTLTNQEINETQEEIRRLVADFKGELR